ncbi:MAG: hypothetical protein ABI630_06825 [Betaproteobacteria bacterium]
MENEKTMKIMTNLDRGEIEARLAEVHAMAQSKGLRELASLFSNVEGMPRAQFEQRISNALKWLADKPEHNLITAQLEMVELNLRNL